MYRTFEYCGLMLLLLALVPGCTATGSNTSSTSQGNTSLSIAVYLAENNIGQCELRDLAGNEIKTLYVYSKDEIIVTNTLSVEAGLKFEDENPVDDLRNKTFTVAPGKRARLKVRGNAYKGNGSFTDYAFIVTGCSQGGLGGPKVKVGEGGG